MNTITTHTHPQTCFSGFVINFVAVNTFSRPEHQLCGYRNPSINKKKLTKKARVERISEFPLSVKKINYNSNGNRKLKEQTLSHIGVCETRRLHKNTHTYIRACNNFYLPLLYVFIFYYFCLNYF